MIKALIFDMFETLITHYESPVYFGKQMSEDMGISEGKFREIWDASENDRSIGKISLEEVVKQILDANNLYSEELFDKVISKRKYAKVECFNHLHENIIPMFEEVRKRGIKIGLITNCFSEEAEVIKESKLFPYFDVALMSCKEGIQKPDKIIFAKCMKLLEVKPEECLYVGDGGSFELETARELNMHPLQAAWYLKDGTTQPSKRKPGFIQVENPIDILKYCD